MKKKDLILPTSGFANFIDEWSHCDFCFTKFGVILEYLESSITTKKAIFRLSNTWSWHVYTIVMDTQSRCGSLLTWKAQIHDGGHQINFDRNLPSSCLVVIFMWKSQHNKSPIVKTRRLRIRKISSLKTENAYTQKLNLSENLRCTFFC